MGKLWKHNRVYFLGLQNHWRWWLQPWNKKTLASWKKSCDQPRQHIKKHRHYFTNKGPYSRSYGFSISYVWMWELDYKESWVTKNWCFWTVVVGEDSWESLGLQGDQTKGNQSWILEGLMLKLKLQYFGHLMWRTDLLGKTLKLGKI